MKHKNHLGKALTEKPMPMRKSVDMKKAMNGYVVSSYGDQGEKLYIAKTEEEAMEYVEKCMSMK